MPGEMVTTLLISFFSFTLLYAAFLYARYNLATERDLAEAATDA